MAFLTDGTIGAELTKTHNFWKFPLGLTAAGSQATKWMYVRASGAITAAGYVVSIDENFSAAMVSTSNDAEGDLVGVAPVAFADGDYGWVQVSGVCVVRVAANAAANVTLNTTATAGELDDDGAAGSMRIDGLVLTTANGGAAATAAAVLSDAIIVGVESGFLDGITPGTAAANKALVLGASGEIATITSLTATTVNVGPTGLKISDSDSTHAVTIAPGNESADRTLSIPVLGGADTISTLGTAQTVTGVKTMSGANVITHAPTGLKIQDSNASHLVTIAPGDESADRTLSLPVLGGADTVMTLGTAQTVTGVKTHSAKDVFNAALNTKQAVTDVHDTTPTNAELETAFGGTAASLGRGFVGTIDDADGNTNGYIVWTSDASFYFVKGTKAT